MTGFASNTLAYCSRRPKVSFVARYQTGRTRSQLCWRKPKLPWLVGFGKGVVVSNRNPTVTLRTSDPLSSFERLHLEPSRAPKCPILDPLTVLQLSLRSPLTLSVTLPGNEFRDTGAVRPRLHPPRKVLRPEAHRLHRLEPLGGVDGRRDDLDGGRPAGLRAGFGHREGSSLTQGAEGATRLLRQRRATAQPASAQGRPGWPTESGSARTTGG